MADDRETCYITPRVVPLTTVWSFPTACTQTIGWIQSCSPPYFADVYQYKSGGYYSPGVCFAGYTVGCVPAPTVTNVNCAPVRPSETVAFCVPSGFVCEPWGYNKDGNLRVMGAMPTLQSTLWGTAVQIRWQSSDSAALGSLYDVLSAEAKTATPQLPIMTTERPPSATSTGSSGGPTSGTQLSTGTGGVGWSTPGAQESAHNGGGLSPGSIAAIALGVVIVVLGSLLATFFLLRRKRRQRAAANLAREPTDGAETNGGAAAELGLSAVQKTELAATQSEPSATELGVQDPRTPELGLIVAEKPELPATRLQPAAAELETQAPRIPELPGSLVVAPVELHTGQGRWVGIHKKP